MSICLYVLCSLYIRSRGREVKSDMRIYLFKCFACPLHAEKKANKVKYGVDSFVFHCCYLAFFCFLSSLS